MKQQSLYRTYRPASFDDVVGQEHVVGALTEQIKQEAIGHAYIFAGSRGLGKTSVARIFARELGTNTSDIYEIDAASNNSVEQIRALTENVHTLPFSSPYKVYVLDEVHMLSKSAWNAFLKTLEEPPRHTIFVLATTELDKVPETVQSRCQVFTFKKPLRADLVQVIGRVSQKEGYELEPGASDLIALLADGSYRDALSVLQKVLSATDTKIISRTLAERITGAPSSEQVHSFVHALAQGTQSEALLVLEDVAQTRDMGLYLTLVLEYVRSVLLTRSAPELRTELEAEWGADAFEGITVLATSNNSRLTHQTLKILLDAMSRMRYSPIAVLPLELAVFELFGE